MKMYSSLRSFRHIIIAVMLLTLGALPAAALERTASSTADHTQFKQLQGPFASGPEVTQACLGCHTQAAQQLQQTTHWTWEFEHPTTGQMLGKRHVVNSFCGSAASNEPFCTSCHTGYGWDDMRQPPPAAESAVDCLICHDTTGGYKKSPTGAGHPIYEFADPLNPSQKRTTN